MNTTGKAVIGATMILAMAAGVAGCSSMGSDAPMKTTMSDGDLPLPETYRSWPKFLSDIHKAEAGQIREIYLNPVGHTTKRGEMFPNGTVAVMEIYKVQRGADGKPSMGGDGRMAKGELAKVFVMGKGQGWGDQVEPTALRNGDWVYSAWMADGKTPSGDNFSTCRSCHLPLASKDFVARYDEYFDKRR